MDTKEKWNLAVFCTAVLVCCLLMVFLVMDEPGEAELTIMDHAQAQGISVAEYPDSLIKLLEDNPETREFVLNYPYREENTTETDLSGYDRGLGVPLLMQWDARWGYIPYGSDMVALTGCGPVCLSMVGYYLTGDEKFYPDRVVEFALENDYYSPGNGSKWTLISEGAAALGLHVKELPLVEEKIAAYLRAGDPIIAVMGPGDFTASGHYIVWTAYDDGMLSVNDPNSYANSGKQWEYNAIKGQVKNLWVITSGPVE